MESVLCTINCSGTDFHNKHEKAQKIGTSKPEKQTTVTSAMLPQLLHSFITFHYTKHLTVIPENSQHTAVSLVTSISTVPAAVTLSANRDAVSAGLTGELVITASCNRAVRLTLYIPAQKVLCALDHLPDISNTFY